MYAWLQMQHAKSIYGHMVCPMLPMQTHTPEDAENPTFKHGILQKHDMKQLMHYLRRRNWHCWGCHAGLSQTRKDPDRTENTLDPSNTSGAKDLPE